jgi:HK97 family phage major capsid protein
VKTIPEIMADMGAITAAAEAEDRSMDDPEIERYEALEADLLRANKSEEIRKRHEAYKAPVTGFPAVIRPAPKGDAALEFAFGRYLRTGFPNTDIAGLFRTEDGERYAQTEGTPSAGGYAVPDTFRARLTEGRSAFGGFMNLAENITTPDGRPMPWPTIIAAVSTEADIAAEGAASAAGADLVFGEASLGAYKYTSTGTSNVALKVSVELLQDAQFDVAAFVARRLGERIARKQAYDLVRGSGSSEPLGIMYGTDGDVATASGSVPTYAKLNSLVHALNPAYRESGATFILNDTTLGVLEQIVDTIGRPILTQLTQGIESGPSGRQRGLLLGYPYTIDQAIANLSNDVQGIGFGNWSAAYVVRHVRDVQILVNPYSTVGYVQYDAWARMDGTVQDAAAYVTMEGTT